MKITETGISGKEAFLSDLDHVMEEVGFTRHAWDYNHATYDLKLQDKSAVYYVRVQANVVKGKLENPHTLLKLEEPYVGKAVFPHGVEYESPVPANVLQTGKTKLQLLNDKLSSLGA